MSGAPTFGNFSIPAIENEPMRNYEPKSAHRAELQAAIDSMRASAPFDVPIVINGKEIRTGKTQQQMNPCDVSSPLCTYHEAGPEHVQQAIEGALAAKAAWSDMPWNDRAAIFLKVADLIAHKYRYEIMAATMLGQGKNVWQAEIDSAAESCDFLRFGVQYLNQLYSIQPSKNAPMVWNRHEYRPLEGFVLAVSPFNFTAISVQLCATPAMVGNVCVWKPSPMAIYSNYLLMKIYKEAGMPDGVIQFVPGPAEPIVGAAVAHREMAALHFTGSTFVCRSLFKQIYGNVDNYRSYPRIVAETGGKNFHLVTKTADVDAAVYQSMRSAFEYSGQKCSALSRLYVPKSMWEGEFKPKLLAELSKITQGPTHEFKHFMGAVISQTSFEKSMSLIDAARKAGGKIVAGGKGDNSKGYFVEPTVIETEDPFSVTMKTEIFGPVLTVYPYPDETSLESICKTIDTTTEYALTGSVFATDRETVVKAGNLLRNSSGMWYINSKCTGAVVGQQCFGGGRASGTNDKAGSMFIFTRFVNVRTIKEEMVQPTGFMYPHNLE